VARPRLVGALRLSAEADRGDAALVHEPPEAAAQAAAVELARPGQRGDHALVPDRPEDGVDLLLEQLPRLLELEQAEPRGDPRDRDAMARLELDGRVDQLAAGAGEDRVQERRAAVLALARELLDLVQVGRGDGGRELVRI